MENKLTTKSVVLKHKSKPLFITLNISLVNVDKWDFVIRVGQSPRIVYFISHKI
jgi:hypothetical protein